MTGPGNRRTAALSLLLCVATLAVVAVTASAQYPSSSIDLTDDERAWLAEHPEIRLGPYGNYRPAQYIEDGVHLGIAADYVAVVESMLGIEFAAVSSETWQEILDKSRDREIDFIALAADTVERRSYLSFTEAYLDLPAVIIAAEGVERRLTPEELEGMHVVVVSGYAVHEYLLSTFPQLDLDPIQDTRTGLRMVSLGEADVFVSDLAVASYYIEEEGISNLRVVGESGFVYHMGFACRSDWPEFRDILEKTLAQISPEQRSEIYNRWIHMSHETEFASKRTLNTLLVVLGVVTFLAGLVFGWNRLLQRRVADRTADLNQELAERTRAVNALAESEERTRMIISSALDAVITMDSDGMVTGWSKQATVDFGWEREEAIGHLLADLIIPESHREEHERGVRRFVETGEAHVLNQRLEMTALHRDGHEFPIELSIAPLQRERSFEFSAFIRNITERKQAEAELEKHREKLEELVVKRTAGMKTAKEAAEAAEAKLAERVQELESALAEVKQLRGLLPICSYCKRVREGEDYTQSLEVYFAAHSDATFSHGVCPDCYDRHVRPQLDRL